MRVKQTTYKDNKKTVRWIEVPDPNTPDSIDPVPELDPEEDPAEWFKDED